VEDLELASQQHMLKSRLRRSIAPQVLVIDEIGYTSLSSPQANQLFELVRERYERGATILTSNTSFAQWGKLMNDEVLATALLDRLLHHAEVDIVSTSKGEGGEKKGEENRAEGSPDGKVG
jgi:DNA replication protein DnaC